MSGERLVREIQPAGCNRELVLPNLQAFVLGVGIKVLTGREVASWDFSAGWYLSSSCLEQDLLCILIKKAHSGMHIQAKVVSGRISLLPEECGKRL